MIKGTNSVLCLFALVTINHFANCRTNIKIIQFQKCLQCKFNCIFICIQWFDQIQKNCILINIGIVNNLIECIKRIILIINQHTGNFFDFLFFGFRQLIQSKSVRKQCNTHSYVLLFVHLKKQLYNKTSNLSITFDLFL